MEGCEPFAEDLWTEILIDNFTFHGVKLCSRCKVISKACPASKLHESCLGDKLFNYVHDQVPTISQETGIGGQEPIETLRNFRSDKVLQPKKKPQGKVKTIVRFIIIRFINMRILNDDVKMMIADILWTEHGLERSIRRWNWENN